MLVTVKCEFLITKQLFPKYKGQNSSFTLKNTQATISNDVNRLSKDGAKMKRGHLVCVQVFLKKDTKSTQSTIP